MVTEDPRMASRALGPRQIVAIVLVLITLVLVFQNRQPVTLTLLVMSVEMPLWIATVVILVVGVLVGWLLARGRYRSRSS